MKATRHTHIIEILDDRSSATVVNLSEELGVSEMTIRRDLVELERTGVLRRVHGGATRSLGRAYEPPFRVRQTNEGGTKREVAKLAATLIDEGDAIGLDVGSTALEMVPFITASHLTIVTASLRVATAVAENHALEQRMRLIITGGIVRAEELSLIGQAASDTYKELRIDKAFVGVGGISPESGATEFNLEDTEVKRAMIGSAQQVIVLADSTKINRIGFAEVARINQIDTMITDSHADATLVEQFRAAGVTVLIAEAAD